MIKPVISEKSMAEVAKGRFTFVVSKNADKKNIKQAVEDKFKVNVLSVSTNITKGKTTRVGVRRIEKALPSYKKAIVHLKEGQKIDMFDVGQG
ncbi:MAG: 50S ribosomal protein L23 [bacterium]|nr:50S ribosomal protein L23 [bacterium]